MILSEVCCIAGMNSGVRERLKYTLRFQVGIRILTKKKINFRHYKKFEPRECSSLPCQGEGWGARLGVG